MGPTWVLSAPRWAPCWPREPCYQGCFGALNKSPVKIINRSCRWCWQGRSFPIHDCNVILTNCSSTRKCIAGFYYLKNILACKIWWFPGQRLSLWGGGGGGVVGESAHGFYRNSVIPDSKVHGANMGPTWVLSAPEGTHVCPSNRATRDGFIY